MSKKNLTLLGLGLLVMAIIIGGLAWSQTLKPVSEFTNPSLDKMVKADSQTTVLAGGCFWCVEADLEKLPGVEMAISGYIGGEGTDPTYQDYAERGFREAVMVTYDPSLVSYGQLVEWMLKHSDPTDGEGSFHDRGPEYAPAVYYQNDEEKMTAETVIKELDESGAYDKPLAVAVLPQTDFYPAEDYHQDYYRKNALKYSYYRHASGRDAFIESHWGERASVFTTAINTKESEASSTAPWQSYQKPDAQELRKILTPLQFEVTQEQGTERPFSNEYDKNYEAGIYVDILSGEPLYSSKDKFDSGTGWPSFVRPITPDAVVLKADYGLLGMRIEVRSRYADSHLGHVFDDGPADQGGKRYCMNSAALRFIPEDQMAASGYADYLKYVE